MAVQKPCPRCGGAVAVSAPGVAGCRACGGGFVSSKVLVPALIAAGIAPAQLQQIVAKSGVKERPCPACGQLLTSFSVRGEAAHACTPCAATWLDDGALLRLGGVDPGRLAAAADLDVAPRPRAAPNVPASGMIAPSPEPLDDGARDDEGPLGRFTPLGAAPVEDDGATFVPLGRGFSAQGRSTVLGLALKLAAAGVVLGALYFVVTTAFMEGKPTPLPGGAQVLFWDQPVHVDEPLLGDKKVKRFVSPWGTNTLEAVAIPGGGGSTADLGRNGVPEGAVTFFHGWTRMTTPPTNHEGDVWFTELEFVDERDPNKTNKNVGGVCRYYFDATDAWLLCGYSDSNLFARSGKSTSFVESLQRAQKGAP